MADHVVNIQGPCGLHTLPTTILQREVLTRLCPEDLFRLAACCKHLLQAIGSDDVWQPLCEQRGWGPHAAGECMAAFARQQRMLCKECQRPTRYIFKLLGCRLCEACEHQSSRYALVTELEAQQRYGLSAVALQQLEFVVSCGKQLYLRDAVLKLAAPEAQERGASRQLSNTSAMSAGEMMEGHEELEEEEDAGSEDEGGHDAHDDDDGDDDEQSSTVNDKKGGISREEQRSLRKAAKKQAKADQRQRREAKAAGKAASGATYAMLSSSPSARCNGRGMARGRGVEAEQQQQGSSSGGRRGMGGHGRRGPRLTRSSQQPPSRHAVLHQGLYPDEDHISSKLMGSSPKLKSAWLAEREQVMVEYGQFALSGLVLAS